jgi:hypothetical protein
MENRHYWLTIIVVSIILSQISYGVLITRAFTTDIAQSLSIATISPFLILFAVSMVISSAHVYVRGEYLGTLMILLSIPVGMCLGIIVLYSEQNFNVYSLAALPVAMALLDMLVAGSLHRLDTTMSGE